MRDRHALVGFVLLILGFPGLIDAFAGRGHSPAAAGARDLALATAGSFRVQGIQAVLLVGLTLAGRERARLPTATGDEDRA